MFSYYFLKYGDLYFLYYLRYLYNTLFVFSFINLVLFYIKPPSTLLPTLYILLFVKISCPRCSSRHALFLFLLVILLLLILFIKSSILHLLIYALSTFLISSFTLCVVCLFFPTNVLNLFFIHCFLSFPFKFPVLAAAPDIQYPFSRISPSNPPILPKNPCELG